MQTEYPAISVIIACYNGEARLPGCLDSIMAQDYPREKIELLVIDDDSSDSTVAVAHGYGARVYRNGNRNIEMGKSIGLKHTRNELIFLIDDDNRLPSTDWLKKCVTAMMENPEAVGAEAIYFAYNRKDPPANRYCSLYGINDPTAYYLKKRDRLTWVENSWELPGKVVMETGDYYLVEFNERNLPTVGSQGYLTRRDLLLKTNWAPYLFHIDSNAELIRAGHNRYLMMKLDVIHIHSSTLGHFLSKIRRNMALFLRQSALRTYKWPTSRIRLVLAVLAMATVVVPLYDSLRSFSRKPDPAWLLHPVLCTATTFMYGYMMISWHISKLLGLRKEMAAR
ncbi:MAG: glycosyltransferase [Chloroflexi bacterium]|nr:glycosyltransferase [Chloroflexota bacterium]